LINNDFTADHGKFWNEKHAHREELHDDDGNQPVVDADGNKHNHRPMSVHIQSTNSVKK
jgi:hypothetical protein